MIFLKIVGIDYRCCAFKTTFSCRIKLPFSVNLAIGLHSGSYHRTHRSLFIITHSLNVNVNFFVAKGFSFCVILNEIVDIARKSSLQS